MVRLLPAAVSFGVGANPHALNQGGYRSPQHFISAFVDLRMAFETPLDWWESSLYVSLPGLLLLLYFGMWAPFFTMVSDKCAVS